MHVCFTDLITVWEMTIVGLYCHLWTSTNYERWGSSFESGKYALWERQVFEGVPEDAKLFQFNLSSSISRQPRRPLLEFLSPLKPHISLQTHHIQNQVTGYQNETEQFSELWLVEKLFWYKWLSTIPKINFNYQPMQRGILETYGACWWNMLYHCHFP